MLVLYLLCGLVVLTWAANAIIYLRYAQANYPKSRRWECLLFGAPFLFGSTVGALAASRDVPGLFFVLFVPTIGIAVALMHRFLFVSNMQRIMPKRVTPRDRGPE